MRFLHLSDIHFLRKYHKAEKGYNSIFNNMTNPVEQIKSCLKKVDLKTIDFSGMKPFFLWRQLDLHRLKAV